MSRAISPPPHIIGQIVEMGFSPQQARIALAATDTGIDVQAALDSLLNAASAENSHPSNGRDSGDSGRQLSEEEAWERREAERERQRRRRNGGGGGAPSGREAPLATQRESAPNRERERPDDDPSSAAATETAQQLREQADKVLLQASEIGLNVFKTANAFWSSGKAQLQKAYEERKAAAGGASPANGASAAAGPGGAGGAGRGGRPRWATAEVGEEDDEGSHIRTPRQTGGFRDEDDDDDADENGRPEEPRKPARPSVPNLEVDLLGGGGSGDSGRLSVPATETAGGAGYKSPHRRRPGREAAASSNPAHAPAATPGATSSSSSRRPPGQAPPQQASKPTPRTRTKITRTLVPASASSLSQSHSHRTKGTAAYKLGAYADAESSYSRAIAALPAGHVLLVPLMNNRAAAKGKIGDMRGVVDDSTAVLQLIEPSSSSSSSLSLDDGKEKFNPANEHALPPIDVGAANGEPEIVNLADGYVKALQRRAQAYEGMEKWDSARADWERLVSADWGAALRIRDEAVRGVGRCRRMVGGGGGGPASSTAPSASRTTTNASSSSAAAAAAPPKPKPKPKPRPIQDLADLNANNSSQGVAKLRAQASTQEAEDLERVRLKDSIDAKLVGWKGGKESNLRALIASLDTVLWPELGWQKVGLHELVTPNQVKIRYMKAIARVHPDKVSYFCFYSS